MFKVGDKVRCVDAKYAIPSGHLTENGIYTVKGTTGNDVLLEESFASWLADRFELVKENNVSIDEQLMNIWHKELILTDVLREIYDFGVEHGKNPPVQKWVVYNNVTEQYLVYKGQWANFQTNHFATESEAATHCFMYLGCVPNSVIVLKEIS